MILIELNNLKQKVDADENVKLKDRFYFSSDIKDYANPKKYYETLNGLREIHIDSLELPNRAYNGLRRAHIAKVGELLECSEHDLTRMRNMGAKTIDQILTISRAWLIGYFLSKSVSNDVNKLGNSVSETTAKEETVSDKIFDKSIKVLDLTKRPYNILRQNGIKTVADLISVPLNKLSKMHNMGVKSLQEIQAKLTLWSKECHEGNEVQTEKINPKEARRLRVSYDMNELKDHNYNLREIGDLYSITIERARQIITYGKHQDRLLNYQLDDDVVFLNGREYQDLEDLCSAQFKEKRCQDILFEVEKIKNETGWSLNLIINYLIDKERNSSVFYINYVRYHNISEYVNKNFPKNLRFRVFRAIENIKISEHCDENEAVINLNNNPDRYFNTIKVVYDGVEYNYKSQMFNALFPDYDSKRIRSAVSQREKKMSFDDAISYTLKNPPKEKDFSIVYKHKKYLSQIDLFRKLFPDRNPYNLYQSVVKMMKKTNISFEEAVERIKNYNYKNKAFKIRYRGKTYSSLRSISRDFDLNAELVSYYAKKNDGDVIKTCNQLRLTYFWLPSEEALLIEKEKRDLALKDPFGKLAN